MKTYRAGNVQDAELRRELGSIERAAQRADPFALLEIRHTEPDKLFAGLVVIADGSDFNPTGDGAGIYKRNEANTGWVRLATLIEATALAHNYSRRFLLMGA